MAGVRESVKSGGTIAAPMRDEPSAFPMMVTQMVAVGEETGALESMLSKIADFYEDEVAAALKAPMKIGGIVQKVALARFSRTFSGLIAAGVPMLEAIEITGKTSGNKVVEKAMDEVRESVKKGGSLTKPMTEVPEAFPVMVTQMIGVGEETGALETMMTKVADFYEEQVEAAVKALTSILEPVMIVVVGAIVGFIVIAMYLPMFKVYDSIK